MDFKQIRAFSFYNYTFYAINENKAVHKIDSKEQNWNYNKKWG